MGIFLKEKYFFKNSPADYSGIGPKNHPKGDLLARASLHPCSHLEHLRKPDSCLGLGDTTEKGPVLTECAFRA